MRVQRLDELMEGFILTSALQEPIADGDSSANTLN